MYYKMQWPKTGQPAVIVSKFTVAKHSHTEIDLHRFSSHDEVLGLQEGFLDEINTPRF